MRHEQDLVTNLVVGRSISLTMGVPVAPRSGDGLRLRTGQWELAGLEAVPLWKRLKASNRPTAAAGNVIRLVANAMQRNNAARKVPSREMWIGAGVGSAALLAVATFVYLHGTPEREQAWPAPAQLLQRPQVVRVVPAPYEGTELPMAPAAAGAALPVHEGPLPIQMVAETAPPTPPQIPAAPAPAATLQAKPLAEQKPHAPALIIDEVPTLAAVPSPKAQSQLAATTTAIAHKAAASKAAAPRLPASTAKSASPTTAATPKAAPPALPSGAGLVTITPDGKLAVFSNPKTRLPEQFRVGDQLPNGETLRSIDAKEGKVITNAKEYALE
jgi:hypothetical protein